MGGAASARQLVNPGRGSQYQILRRPDRIAGGAAVVLPACGGGARPLYKLGTQVRFTTRATHAPNTVADERSRRCQLAVTEGVLYAKQGTLDYNNKELTARGELRRGPTRPGDGRGS